MPQPGTTDIEMRPPSPVFPSNINELVKDAIDCERQGCELFQDPEILDKEESLRLMNIIGTVIQAPIPTNFPSRALIDALIAYQLGRFEDLATKYFNAHSEDSDQQDHGIVASGSEDSLREGFHSEYKGDYPQAFIEQLRTYRRECSVGTIQKGRPYSWSVPIVQSSGMGKSRMIREVSQLAFVIPINVREALPPTIATYPPPDDNVRDYFLDLAPKTDAEIQIGCAILLTELFRHVKELVSQWKDVSGPVLAVEWTKYLEDGETIQGVGQNRLRVYNKIILRANQRIRGLSKTVTVPKLAGELSTQCRGLTRAIGLSGADFFCVAFDEAHTLTAARILKPGQSEDVERRRNVYSNLEKVLTYIYADSPFFVFLSTNSHLHRLAPSISAHPSSRRVIDDGHILIPPWTELPFNVFAEETMEAHKPLTLNKISTVKFMVGIGRALWHVYYTQEVAIGQHKSLRHVLHLAVSKLVPDSAGESENYLAAIGVRVGFTFEAMSTPARELESRMVEQHMRVAVVVPSHREYMRTASPPEPILAEAAGRSCDLAKHGAATLMRYFGRGVLARGERGEVVGRLLLTIAHDIALCGRELGPTRVSEDAMYHRPVALLALLKALFHEDHHATILDARPTGDARGAPLRDAFKDAYIHFSHFGVAAGNDTLNVKNMFKCLATGTALQASMNQRSIDAVIPVHLGSISSPITEATTSSINLQFKNRDDARACYVDRKIVIPNEEVPTISLILELGTKGKKSGVVVSGVERTHSEPPRGSYWDGKHYELVAYGHRAKTYNVISEDKEATFTHILAATQLMTEYPRSGNKKMLAMVRNMQFEITPDVLVWPKSANNTKDVSSSVNM